MDGGCWMSFGLVVMNVVATRRAWHERDMAELFCNFIQHRPTYFYYTLAFDICWSLTQCTPLLGMATLSVCSTVIADVGAPNCTPHLLLHSRAFGFTSLTALEYRTTAPEVMV